MPIKLISKTAIGPAPKQIIDEMRKAYESKIHSWSTEQLKNQYPDRSDISEGKSVWISKNEIDALLNENSGDGIRIYFACHTRDSATEKNLKYLGLHTVVLVATKDRTNAPAPEVENAIDQDHEDADPEKANSVTFSAMGLDLLPTCPPRCTP